jgi:hypothetical protein
MSDLDFGRAEYEQPTVIDGQTGAVDEPGPASVASLPLALLFGAVAAIVGTGVYAAVAMTGFMASIVVIGIGWVVARAMMTATGGRGGQPFQIAAVALMYFSCSTGELISILLGQHSNVLHVFSVPGNYPTIAQWIFFGPLMEFTGNPVWAALGLLFLFYGGRRAWAMAAGSPGFGSR